MKILLIFRFFRYIWFIDSEHSIFILKEKMILTLKKKKKVLTLKLSKRVPLISATPDIFKI